MNQQPSRPPHRILDLSQDREEALRQAVGAIRAGELVVVPTDTVYGLAADAFTPQATARVFELKRRPTTLPLPVLVSRPKQAWALSVDVGAGALALADAFWPGALTMILRQSAELEWNLGETDGTIAVRVPDRRELLDILEVTGPLAVTSANVSGEPTPNEVASIADRFGDEVAIYLDGGTASGETPSTIVDMTAAVPVILREGAVGADRVRRVLASAPVTGETGARD